MDTFSMDIFNRYSSFKAHFKLVSRTVSSNGTVVSEYESTSPVKDHKYHLRRDVSSMSDHACYSLI